MYEREGGMREERGKRRRLGRAEVVLVIPFKKVKERRINLRLSAGNPGGG